MFVLKKTFSTQNAVRWGLTIGYIVILVAPVAFLFWKALLNLVAGEDFTVPGISLPLFASSVLIETASTLICVALGILAALFLWNYFEQKRKILFYIILLCALIPPFIHVHSWIKTMDAFNSAVFNLTGLPFNFTGIGAVVWTTAISYLPFTTALCFFGLQSIPAEIVDLIRMETDGRKAFFKNITPYFAPYSVIGALFIFLININDYAIPSVFGVNVYALELFALFSASGNIYSIALSSLPLIALSVVIVAVIAFITRKSDLSENFSKNINPFSHEPFMRNASIAGGIGLLAFVTVPVLSMIIESFGVDGLPDIILDSSDQIFYSLIVSALTAVVSVLPAALYAYAHFMSRRSQGITVIFTLPFIIPSAILGLSMIVFWNQGMMTGLYQSSMMTVIGLSTRFSIIAILYLMLKFKRLDRELADSTKLSLSFFQGFHGVILPMMRRDILACVLMIFALSMGEYGIVLLITPPGYQMLTIKIYNYLHYGSSDVVFALNLFVFLLVVAVAASMVLIYSVKTGEKGT
jgi:iron(III) transport system permease protein